MRKVTITSRSGEVLAQGAEPEEVLHLEGNWYFDPARVNAQALEVTERTYTCPYKGICFWVDYVGFEGRIHEVAWVYREPMAGYEKIAGRYGFYSNDRAGTYARVQPA
jgi:uncharacterized protein (DUF427 family)